MTCRFPQSLRWVACLALALGFHAAGAAALLARWNDDADQVANAPVIMIDLAPVAAAPDTKPSEAPPDQVASKPQVDPEPQPDKPPEPEEVTPPPEREPNAEPEKPVEKVELPPAPALLPELMAALPPPKSIEETKAEVKREPKKEEKKEVKKKPRHKRAALASAPSAADSKAERAAAPAPGASARNSNALPNWTSQLVSRLERYKRYPAEAESRRETGVVKLAFSVDRSGGVHHARIVGSSGSSLLDRETLSLLGRAAPLPAPPAELTSSEIAVVVPIRYNIR